MVRRFIVMVQTGRDQLVDILLMGWRWGKCESASSTFRSNWSGVDAPVDCIPLLRRCPCGLHTIVNCWLLPPEDLQYLQKSSKLLWCVSLSGEPGACPKATLLFLLTDCFSLVSYPLPSLINNYLNLSFRTQGSLGGWRKPIFCHQRNGGTQNGLEAPRALLGIHNQGRRRQFRAGTDALECLWSSGSQPLISPSVWWQFRQVNEEKVELQKDRRRLPVSCICPFSWRKQSLSQEPHPQT